MLLRHIAVPLDLASLYATGNYDAYIELGHEAY